MLSLPIYENDNKRLPILGNFQGDYANEVPVRRIHIILTTISR